MEISVCQTCTRINVFVSVLYVLINDLLLTTNQDISNHASPFAKEFVFEEASSQGQQNSILKAAKKGKTNPDLK